MILTKTSRNFLLISLKIIIDGILNTYQSFLDFRNKKLKWSGIAEKIGLPITFGDVLETSQPCFRLEK